MTADLTGRPAWYIETIRAHEQALKAPVGTEHDRNERAAVEIARAIYAKRFGDPPDKRLRTRCRWQVNSAGARVIRYVEFIGWTTHHGGDRIELPGWDGGPAAAPDQYQPPLF